MDHRPSLLTLIWEDLVTNYRRPLAPGFQALALHRYGSWCMTLHGPRRFITLIVHRLLQLLVRNLYGIELPATARIGRRVIIAHQSGIVVHPEAEIGDGCVIRHNVTIGARHRTARSGRQAPILGRDVELGVGAVLIGPIRIGDGVKVGPNAVVMTDVPAGAVVRVEPPQIITRAARPATDS